VLSGVPEYLDKEISRGGWGEIVKQVFLPVEKVYKVQNGKKVMRERNYYPGYVMIEVTDGKLGDDLRDAIKNTNSVIHFLGKENPIALRIAKQVGLDKIVEMAKHLGVKSHLDKVPGLVLGQSVVNVLEMTGAFGSVGNAGVWNRPHAISRILDSNDCRDRNDFKTCRVIYSFDQDPDANKRVLRTQVADTMTRLLRGVVTNGTGRSAELSDLAVSGKTGTTNDNVDLWFIGFIPSRRLVTGIWLGNDNNSPTSGSSVANTTPPAKMPSRVATRSGRSMIPLTIKSAASSSDLTTLARVRDAPGPTESTLSSCTRTASM